MCGPASGSGMPSSARTSASGTPHRSAACAALTTLLQSVHFVVQTPAGPHVDLARAQDCVSEAIAQAEGLVALHKKDSSSNSYIEAIAMEAHAVMCQGVLLVLGHQIFLWIAIVWLLALCGFGAFAALTFGAVITFPCPTVAAAAPPCSSRPKRPRTSRTTTAHRIGVQRAQRHQPVRQAVSELTACGRREAAQSGAKLAPAAALQVNFAEICSTLLHLSTV